MNTIVFVLAAILLSIERLTYVWAWRRSEQFIAVCRRIGSGIEPIDALEGLFRLFKVLQLAVFVGWSMWWDGGALTVHGTDGLPLAVASALFVAGQILNFAVFKRLGREGVFYGVRFGHLVPWCNDFPFTILRHPQYVGAVLSIWGFFVLLRYPQPDWMVLPLLETAYYWLGARLESDA